VPRSPSVCSFQIFFFLAYKYSPSHPVLEHPPAVIFADMRDWVSHEHKKTGRLQTLCILIFKLFSSRWDDTCLTELQQTLAHFDVLVIPSRMKFGLLVSFLNIWILPNFQRLVLVWFCSTFWWRDMDIYLVLWNFTFRQTFLLVTIGASFLWYFMFSTSKLKLVA
jgi:hypothetical protein